ncbi:MAG TPA: HAMP domain-containing sensor histidine kinase [Vicinamibacterales bacterium]
MLYEFIATYRDPIIARARQKLTARPWPSVSPEELENGVPLFLTQLSEKLRSQSTGAAHSQGAIGAGATRHGRDLMALGFTVSQVVHDYGDICQAITEIAIEHEVPITTDEFKTLNGCLDTAIAEAVTEHARITAQSRSSEEFERSGHLAHETRDLLNTAILAYQALKQGTVAINGNTGAVLGRSLMGLRDLVDSTLSEIRLAANQQRRERVAVTPFLNDIAAAGRLHAESRGLHLVLEPGESTWAVRADQQVLASAVTNLLNNAFKFTPAGGRVALRASLNEDSRLLIEVEDECGGIPASVGDPFQPFGERRGRDRTGLGLGLSIARKAVRAHGGDIHIRNAPGKGCVFTIDLPLATDTVPA